MLGIVERGDALFERREDGTYIVYQKIRDEGPRQKAYRTLLLEVGTVADGTAQLKELFEGRSPFDYPKPSSLVRHLLSVGSENEDDIIVDFFAGSCTSAHAVLETNREGALARQYVMVQLPEPTEAGARAKEMGFQNIADIGKERMRRAIRKLEEENNGKLDMNDREEPEDLGFRVFKLKESHFRRWTGTEEKDGDKLAEQMDLYVDPLLPGWKPLDVIWEVALQEGYSPSSRIERLKKPTDNTVYRVADKDRGQSFLICLDDRLKKGAVSTLGLGKDDVFICRDVALDDEFVANLALQCRLKVI